MKHVFIVNPLAGRGRSLEIAKNIENVCKKENIDFMIHYTTESKDATRIAREYENDKCIIFSVGGDGTMNEVLNGLVGSNNLFGVIPAGSGNDFYKTLRNIDESYPTIDIGKINDMYFINVVCIGIDAEIANNVDIMKDIKIPRSQIYNASILYTFFKYKFKEIEFTLNEMKNKDKYTILTICNGNFYGGGYKIAPNASISDGLFDIYFVSKISKLKIPALILKIIRGTHESSPLVHKNISNSIHFSSKEDIVANIDGETLVDKHFNIQLIKDGLTLYNNKELINKFLDIN